MPFRGEQPFHLEWQWNEKHPQEGGGADSREAAASEKTAWIRLVTKNSRGRREGAESHPMNSRLRFTLLCLMNALFQGSSPELSRWKGEGAENISYCLPG